MRPMALESWIAVRADVRPHLVAVLRDYGFYVTDREAASNTSRPFEDAWRMRPPEGQLAFYAFYDEPWTLVLDPQFIIWEIRDQHCRLSLRFSAPVVAVVVRDLAHAYGYGWFENGATRRWVFRQGDVTAQEEGLPLDWERGLRPGTPNIGARIRERLGIQPERADSILALFALPSEAKPAKGFFSSLRRRAKRKEARPSY